MDSVGSVICGNLVVVDSGFGCYCAGVCWCWCGFWFRGFGLVFGFDLGCCAAGWLCAVLPVLGGLLVSCAFVVGVI